MAFPEKQFMEDPDSFDLRIGVSETNEAVKGMAWVSWTHENKPGVAFIHRCECLIEQ